MRAITLDGPDTAPVLREDLPVPAPADNDVLVRVHASSVNPVDNSIAAGALAQMGCSTSTRSSSAATTPAWSSSPAPPSATTSPATRSTGSSYTPIRPCTTAPGPS
jgi:hypothetical protein